MSRNAGSRYKDDDIIATADLEYELSEGEIVDEDDDLSYEELEEGMLREEVPERKIVDEDVDPSVPQKASDILQDIQNKLKSKTLDYLKFHSLIKALFYSQNQNSGPVENQDLHDLIKDFDPKKISTVEDLKQKVENAFAIISQHESFKDEKGKAFSVILSNSKLHQNLRERCNHITDIKTSTNYIYVMQNLCALLYEASLQKNKNNLSLFLKEYDFKKSQMTCDGGVGERLQEIKDLIFGGSDFIASAERFAMEKVVSDVLFFVARKGSEIHIPNYLRYLLSFEDESLIGEKDSYYGFFRHFISSVMTVNIMRDYQKYFSEYLESVNFQDLFNSTIKELEEFFKNSGLSNIKDKSDDDLAELYFAIQEKVKSHYQLSQDSQFVEEINQKWQFNKEKMAEEILRVKLTNAKNTISGCFLEEKMLPMLTAQEMFSSKAISKRKREIALLPKNSRAAINAKLEMLDIVFAMGQSCPGGAKKHFMEISQEYEGASFDRTNPFSDYNSLPIEHRWKLDKISILRADAIYNWGYQANGAKNYPQNLIDVLLNNSTEEVLQYLDSNAIKLDEESFKQYLTKEPKEEHLKSIGYLIKSIANRGDFTVILQKIMNNPAARKNANYFLQKILFCELSEKDNLAIIKIILPIVSNLHLQEKNKLLRFLVRKNFVDSVEIFLGAFKDHEYQDSLLQKGSSDKKSALETAIERKSYDIANLLLERLIAVCEDGLPSEAVEAILGSLFNTKFTNISLNKILSNIDRSLLGNILLKNKDANKRIALESAVYDGKKEVVQCLLQNGCILKTPLKFPFLTIKGDVYSLAARRGHQDLRRNLLTINQKQQELHLLIKRGATDQITKLLEDLSAEDLLCVMNANSADGFNAASLAAKNNNASILKILLDKGANPYPPLQGKKIKDPFSLAIENKNSQCLAALLSHASQNKTGKQKIKYFTSKKFSIKNRDLVIATIDAADDELKKKLSAEYKKWITSESQLDMSTLLLQICKSLDNSKFFNQSHDDLMPSAQDDSRSVPRERSFFGKLFGRNRVNYSVDIGRLRFERERLLREFFQNYGAKAEERVFEVRDSVSKTRRAAGYRDDDVDLLPPRTTARRQARDKLDFAVVRGNTKQTTV